MKKSRKLAAVLAAFTLVAGGTFTGVAEGAERAPATAELTGEAWANSKRYRNADVSVFSINTHAGAVIANGGLRYIRRNVNPGPDILLFQEVKHRDDLKRALHREMGRSWRLTTDKQISTKKNAPGLSYVAYDSRKFRLRADEVHRITNGEKKYPRQMPVARLEHKITGRVFVVTSIHVAPLGKGFLEGNDGQRRIQARQLKAYADRMGDVRPKRVAIAGGDTNQNLDLKDSRIPKSLRSQWSEHIFGQVGMRPAHEKLGGRVTIDDIFLRQDQHASFKTRKTYTMPVRGAQAGHMGILTVISVKRLTAPDPD